MATRFLAGLITLAFCFIIAPPAHAQSAPTPEKTALVKELMTLINASTNSDAVIDQILEQDLKEIAPLIPQELLKEIPQEKLSPDEQKRLKSEADEAAKRILVRIRAEAPKRVNFGEVLERVGIEIYGKHFTEEELKELISLYKSPALQKYLRLSPQITSEMFSNIDVLITRAVGRTMDELLIEEIKKLKTK